MLRVTQERGKSFLDQIDLDGRGRFAQTHPQRESLYSFSLVALTIVFLAGHHVFVYVQRFPGAQLADMDNPTTITSLVALFVCLAPTTIGALLSAIGIAGMSRLNRANVLAMSGRAVEAAGDVDILMLDKTGTITRCNRQACEFVPVDGVAEEELADAAQLASLTDETPEGRSIVVLAKERFGLAAVIWKARASGKHSVYRADAHERRQL